MAQQQGFVDYLRAAFNARPFGMFVPPNWIGLGAFALLGLANPGFWVLGLGLELGYLAVLATNPRFQRTVHASRLSSSDGDWQRRLAPSSRGSIRRIGALYETLLIAVARSSISSCTAGRFPTVSIRRAKGWADCCGCTFDCWWRVRPSAVCSLTPNGASPSVAA